MSIWAKRLDEQESGTKEETSPFCDDDDDGDGEGEGKECFSEKWTISHTRRN